MSGFGVPFGNFFSSFPLGLEGDSFLVPIIDGGGNSVHRHDSAHEGGRDVLRLSTPNISITDLVISFFFFLSYQINL